MAQHITRNIPKDLLWDFKSQCASQGKTMNQTVIELIELFTRRRLELVPEDILEVLKSAHMVIGEMLIENRIEDEDDILKNLHKQMFRIIQRLGER